MLKPSKNYSNSLPENGPSPIEAGRRAKAAIDGLQEVLKSVFEFYNGYDPLYQITCTIGGLQITALKQELVDGGKMSYDQFHHAFMEQNIMPIEMERAILTNQPPAKDFKAAWQFYRFLQP